MTEVWSNDTVATQSEADMTYDRLRHEIGDLARNARTLDDVQRVAHRVRLLKLHRPRTCDILASSELNGSGYVEYGFATADGFVGTEAPRVLCEHHTELTPWPCGDLTELHPVPDNLAEK